MINNVFKKFSIIIICSFISCFSSILFAESSVHTETIEEFFSGLEQRIIKAKQECFENKQNNYKNVSTGKRLTNIYLGSILDYLLDHSKNILEERNIKNSDLCLLYSDVNVINDIGIANING